MNSDSCFGFCFERLKLSKKIEVAIAEQRERERERERETHTTRPPEKFKDSLVTGRGPTALAQLHGCSHGLRAIYIYKTYSDSLGWEVWVLGCVL